MVDAVLPAGGQIKGAPARELGVELKALLRFGGQTVLARTLRTLRSTGRVGRIAVIGPDEIAPHAEPYADVVLPEAESGAGNILTGLRWLAEAGEPAPSERALILTTDLPFLTPTAVTGFLDACPRELELCVPVLSRRDFLARFPGARCPCVRLGDGDWLIGCAFLVQPLAVLRNRLLIERVFASRRSQLAMARLLGLRFVLRFLTRRLRIEQIEAKCVELLGCTGAAIHGCAPELGFDIDYLRDFRYAVAHWRQR